jgi:VIT1/CCC1 family predicted Fe2+/Mn2+ transporter
VGARESWAQEKESAWLYRVLAESEPVDAHCTLYAKLADVAESQAAIWEKRAPDHGPFTPSLRARVVAALVRRLGARRMRGVLSAMKVRGLSVLEGPAPAHEMPKTIADVGGRHRRAKSAGGLRAAVFGANDGLVSNASLILGVAGATNESGTILLTGVAGMLAGAFSMAAGEYISMRSQREMFEHQIAAERDELEEYPEQEEAELALIYAARGLEPDEAKRVAARIFANPEIALDTLAREELGLDPTSLGSPWLAASSSFAAFAVGALVPLAPFLITTGPRALYATVGLTAVALFAVGASLSLFTGRGALGSGLRMLAIGGAAALATFAIGRLFGVGLA